MTWNKHIINTLYYLILKYLGSEAEHSFLNDIIHAGYYSVASKQALLL